MQCVDVARTAKICDGTGRYKVQQCGSGKKQERCMCVCVCGQNRVSWTCAKKERKKP